MSAAYPAEHSNLVNLTVPFKLVAVALANKMARIAFAILRSKTVYREIPA